MWPISAIGDFRKKKKEDAQIRERDKVMARYNQGMDQDKPFWRGAAMCDLCLYADTPGMAAIATDIVNRVEARYGLKEAMHDAIYLMNCMRNAEVQSAVAEKTFLLAAKVDRANENEMSGVAMAANLIAFNAPAGSDQRERGIALWREAVGTLSKTRLGVDFAFAAASNAALGCAGSSDELRHPLRGEAIESWYKNVMELAKIDPDAATEEAKRIADNYNDWGPSAPPFTARAKEALQKFSVGN